MPQLVTFLPETGAYSSIQKIFINTQKALDTILGGTNISMTKETKVSTFMGFTSWVERVRK